MSSLTSNTNFLQQVNFKLTIQNPKFTNLEYFCTAVNLPSIAMGEVKQDYRNYQAYFPGETINYETLRVKFMVDEGLKNYTEALSWMQTNASTKGEPLRTDVILSILTSTNTINRQIQFHDAFPTAIGELNFDAQATSIQYISCDLTLRFNALTILK
jgi:hypothetical protein